MRRFTSLPALLGLSLLLTGPVNAEETSIYQWTDENGVVHFSDQKTSNAKEVDISISPSIEMAKPAPRKPKPEPEKKVKYGVSIASPANEATIRSNEGIVVVQTQVKPELNPSLRLQVLLDGRPTADPTPNTTFMLEGVERGEHQLQVKLFDSSGKQLAMSESTTIFLHKASIYSPALDNDIAAPLPE